MLPDESKLGNDYLANEKNGHVSSSQSSHAIIYNMQDQRVDASYHGIAIINGKKVLMR